MYIFGKMVNVYAWYACDSEWNGNNFHHLIEELNVLWTSLLKQKGRARVREREIYWDVRFLFQLDHTRTIRTLGESSLRDRNAVHVVQYGHTCMHEGMLVSTHIVRIHGTVILDELWNIIMASLSFSGTLFKRLRRGKLLAFPQSKMVWRSMYFQFIDICICHI